MPDIARSISDFSKEGVNLPNNVTETASLKYYSLIPKDFLAFFQKIISLISQYQTAFEEENFNRMGQYIVTINSSILNYFKSDAELKANLEGIAEDTASAAKDYISKKQNSSLSRGELEDELLSIVEKYKEKIISSIKLLAAKQTSNKADDKSGSNIVFNTSKNIFLENADSILKAQEVSYNAEISKFAINLGSTILTKFKDFAYKLNEYNIKRFETNLKKLNAAYSDHFYQLITKTNIPKTQQLSVLKILGKILKGTSIAIVNATTHSLAAILKTFFAFSALRKIVLIWSEKIIGAVTGIVKFVFKLIAGAIKTLMRGIKFIFNTVYKIVSFALATTKKIIFSIANLASRVFEKAMGFSVLTAIKNTFVAFFMSYPGAYFLGYVLGRIWRLVLKFVGISDEKIASGDYSVKDDILFPLLNRAKTKIKTIYDNICLYLKNGTKNAQDKVDELITAVKSTKLWTTAVNIGERVKNLVSSITGDDIMVALKTAYGFIEDYVVPAIAAIAYFISAFTGAEPRAFFAARTGALVGLSRIAFFTKHIRARGGIAFLLASGIAIGAGAILGTGEKETKENAGDSKYPLKHLIGKDYASLYGFGGKTTVNEDYLPLVEQKRRHMNGLLAAIDSASGSDRADKKKKYEKIRPLLNALLNEKSMLVSAISQIDEIKNMVTPEDEHTDLSEYPFVRDILYKNGEWAYSKSDFSKIGTTTDQLGFLRIYAVARLQKIRDDLSRFKELADAGNFDELLSQDFNLNDVIKISGIGVSDGKINYKQDGTTDVSVSDLTVDLSYISNGITMPADSIPVQLSIPEFMDKVSNPSTLPEFKKTTASKNIDAHNNKIREHNETLARVLKLRDEIAVLNDRLSGWYLTSKGRKEDEEKLANKRKERAELEEKLKTLQYFNNGTVWYKKLESEADRAFVQSVKEAGTILNLDLPEFLTYLNKLIEQFQSIFIENLSKKNFIFTSRVGRSFVDFFSDHLTHERLKILNNAAEFSILANENKDPLNLAYNVFEKSLDNVLKDLNERADIEKEDIEKLTSGKNDLLKMTRSELEKAIESRTSLQALREKIKQYLDEYDKKKER